MINKRQRLGSKQRRVLAALVKGPFPIEYSEHLNRTIGPIEWLDRRRRVGKQVRWIEDREAYRIAERLAELGFAEIDEEMLEVRSTPQGKLIIKETRR